LAVAVALPAGSSAALVQVRGSVPNADIALLILAAVLVVAASGRSGAVVVAAGSAALSYDYFHTLPYHSLTIANHNDVITTVVLGFLGLVIGLVAARAAGRYEELVLVVAVGALSQAVPGPARLAVNHQGLDVCLSVLVFVTALSIPTSALASLGAKTRRLAVALVASTIVLPALGWAVSRLVAAAALRRGVLVVGLAPAEIASIAAASLASGDVPVAAALLVATTLVTVGGAGIALRLLGGAATIDAVGLLTHLALIVGAPMLVGLLIRARFRQVGRLDDRLARLSVALVLLLVWLVASEVRLSSAYVGVAAALVLFVAGSACLGVVVGWRAPKPFATALLLSTSMRDFAIAAGLAVAAFGASSSGPLGLYGVLVILWGMFVATRVRSPASVSGIHWTAEAVPLPAPARGHDAERDTPLSWIPRAPDGRS
jgi:predicted Na+-dependent transporter